ncbi:MAG: hypothetical protein JJT96_20725 [Opitutales bacterium]|nr:hypothetical protein [Opitutales bacterium]
MSTFTEGYGGRFGDIGGGVVLEPYWAWIAETTGLALIPEPSTVALWMAVAALFVAGAARLRQSDRTTKTASQPPSSLR